MRNCKESASCFVLQACRTSSTFGMLKVLQIVLFQLVNFVQPLYILKLQAVFLNV